MGFMLNVDDSIKLGVDTIQTVDFAKGFRCKNNRCKCHNDNHR